MNNDKRGILLMRFKLGQKIIDKLRNKKCNNITYPSGCDVVKIDEEYEATRWYTYDYENIKDTIIKDESVLFIDIGANNGQSARCAYHFWGGGNNIQCISYEPLPCCIPYLERVKQKYPNYIYKNIAINDKSEKIVFNEIVVGKVTGLSSALPLEKDSYAYSNTDMKNITTRQLEVNSITIKDEIQFWDSFNCSKKILKIDTQGTELKILQQGTEYLKAGNIDVIMIEIMVKDKYQNQCSYIDTISFLNDCGFLVYDIRAIYRERDGVCVGADGFAYGRASEYDFTFVHKKVLLS